MTLNVSVYMQNSTGMPTHRFEIVIAVSTQNPIIRNYDFKGRYLQTLVAA